MISNTYCRASSTAYILMAILLFLCQKLSAQKQTSPSEPYTQNVLKIEANNWSGTDTLIVVNNGDSTQDTIIMFDPTYFTSSVFVQDHTPQEGPDGELVYTLAEQRPQFPGGQQRLEDFIEQNLTFPAFAKGKVNKAVVKVYFIVNQDGSLSDFDAEIQNHNLFRRDFKREAIRLARLMPNWQPAQHKGQNVTFQHCIRIQFEDN